MKSRLAVIALYLGTALAAAHAAPSPTVVALDVELADVEQFPWFHNLPQATDEPGGISVTGAQMPLWTKLGLKTGDVIRAIDGKPAGDRLYLTEGTTVLEVQRGGAPFVLRLALHGDARRKVKLKNDDYVGLLDRTKGRRSSAIATAVTANGKPSGVRIIDDLIHLHAEIQVGDIVRSINGKPIRTEAELVVALENLAIGANEVLLARNGRSIAYSIEREAALDLTKIKRVSDASYEVPRTIRDYLKANFMTFGRDARFVPAITAGKIRGTKLLEIQPGGLYAMLGFRDDDTVIDVDGHTVDSFDDAIRTHTALEEADTITVHLLRRGKPFAIVYTVK